MKKVLIVDLQKNSIQKKYNPAVGMFKQLTVSCFYRYTYNPYRQYTQPIPLFLSLLMYSASSIKQQQHRWIFIYKLLC